ncbi:bifunctional folylpolyglutamate synthase/dihydrofolate synthase [Deinococcus multiflagellatus]|uniref:tetrahydrofolate synthase n=1 Tax=Deinococcus multiflagellatus TaxID=1656887 RepID=A0ABW1ZLG6_9DEIO|nr:folylpolyglutamate synthase/dihydrofolate synthase family protein [Deinococcus multiflagellatus]MBZ9714108.1 bifunctional folylpolyglutamate synthase/dihydrofolate synthase [Deinococcus multiflagellatus]
MVASPSWQMELDWLFAQQRFGIHPGLGRVRALLTRLGDPQRTFETVLVGGTNGKGSTAATLAAMLGAAEIRAGLFTSPHLTRFTERFVVAGEECPEDEVAAALARVRPAAEAEGASFFEIVTALGALLFAEAGVQVAVLEVGLGGRLDATNALDPALSVITNVGLDHTAILGDTLEAIAAEKAGILRPGRPAVTGVSPSLQLILQAQGADLWALGTEAQADVTGLDWAGSTVSLQSPAGQVTFHTPLLGEHGARNAALAALAAQRLGLTAAAMARGAATTRWPGRLEVMPWQGRRVLLDGAHNPDGARALVQALQALGVTRLPVVFGAAEDKDLSGVAAALAPLASHLILTRAALSPRSAAPATLAALFPNIPHTLTESPAQALQALDRLMGDLSSEAALVCGSLYLLGEVRPLLLGQAAETRERWQ